MSRGWPTRPSGDPAEQHRAPFGIGERSLGHLGLDHPRTDTVDADPVRGEIERHRLRQHDQSALRRGVMGLAGERHLGVDRCDVDDRPGAPRRHHRPRGDLPAQVGPFEVGVDDSIPLSLAQIEKRHQGLHPGVVDENVEPAESRRGLLDHRGDLVSSPHVGGRDQRLATGPRDERRCVLHAGFIDVCDHHRRPLFDKPHRDTAPIARARPGDDRNLALESHIPPLRTP